MQGGKTIYQTTNMKADHVLTPWINPLGAQDRSKNHPR